MREIIPKEVVLDLWASGKTGTQIRDMVRRKDGSKFGYEFHIPIVLAARKLGDKRADRKRT